MIKLMSCVSFSTGFSLQCDFPLRNQIVLPSSQFSDNKPQHLDYNVYGARLQVINMNKVTYNGSENYPWI